MQRYTIAIPSVDCTSHLSHSSIPDHQALVGNEQDFHTSPYESTKSLTKRLLPFQENNIQACTHHRHHPLSPQSPTNQEPSIAEYCPVTQDRQ